MCDSLSFKTAVTWILPCNSCVSNVILQIKYIVLQINLNVQFSQDLVATFSI
jgi:hypothetical protein